MRYLFNFSCSVRWTRSANEHFTSRFLQTWKCILSRFNISWKSLLSNFIRLSVLRVSGRSLCGLENFLSVKMDCNTDVATGPVFYLRGTTRRVFEKRSITVNKYLKLSFNLLMSWTLRRSDSHTSITLVTLYGFRRTISLQFHLMSMHLGVLTRLAFREWKFSPWLD